MTLREIAKLTGSSPSAVSRVLNSSGYVSEEKKKAIEKALADYGYKKKEKPVVCPYTSNTVLIIADSLNVSEAYIDYIDGINEYLYSNGYSSYLYLSNYSCKSETEQVINAQKIGFAGVMMINAIETPDLLKAISQSKCPIVLLNRYLRGADIDTVVLDNYKVGYMATKLLIEKGHKKVVQLAGLKDSTASRDRIRGFMDAMRDFGLPVAPDAVVFGNHSYTKGYEYALHFTDNKKDYTALFVASDRMTLGFIDGLYERGVRCPDDISIICTEDTKNLVSGKVKLTTIGYNNRIIGRTAAELFDERRKNPRGEKKMISYTPQIVERESIKEL